jgi:isocitrate/isopropylmalate dehydrogenase
LFARTGEDDVTPRTIVVLEGDQTGQELLQEALRVLDPGVTAAT